MNKKRWTRKIIGRVAIAIIAMALVLLLISTARSKMQEYTSGIFKEDVSEYAGNTQDVQENEVVGPTCESAADMVSYLDGTYTRYLGADILGGVHIGQPIGLLTEPGGENGKHEAGTTVYQWQGYDPWYRIAVRGLDGGNYYYERWTKKELDHLTMEEYLPLGHQVKSIVLRTAKGTQVGQITDFHVIENMLNTLREGAVYTDSTRQMRDGDDVFSITNSAGRYVDLVLMDDSELTIIIFDEEAGYCLGDFRLPDGWLADLYDYEIYEIDESLGSINYGSQLIGEWARPTHRKIEQWVNGKENFAIGTLWVDDQRLCMGYGGCFGPQASRGWAVLADDVAGDLRMEDMEIWYRTTAGDVAYLYFWYPYGQEQLYEDMDAGMDLSKYVKERTVLYEGPFAKVQVRDSVVWTLDHTGLLCREGQVVASDVACFELDASGTIYGTSQGLYRLQERTGEICFLAAGDITAVASAELFVYYATDQGQIRCVRVDGLEDRQVCELDAKGLQWDRMEEWRILLATDQQNTLWSVRNDGRMIKLEDHVEATQLVDYSLWVRMTEDAAKDVSADWTVSEHTGVTNVKRVPLGRVLEE